MTSTMTQFVQKAIDLLGSEELLGRYVSLSSLTVTTAVSNTALAFGGNSEQRYAQWWLWRPSTTTTADKIRNVDSFAPATGTMTHSGTNYSDTTATDEIAILLPPEVDPYKFRNAVNIALQQVREWDETIIPVVRGQEWHWVHELDWIQDSASIRDVFWTHNPVITRNRYLQKRTLNSSGVWVPDFWTVTDNADTSPFETTDYRGQKYVYSLQRAGGLDAYIIQTFGAMRTGVSGAYPVGETLTGVAVVTPGASTLRIILNSEAVSENAVNSGTGFQTITTSMTLDSPAIALESTLVAETNNATHRVYELYICIGALTDEIRRDDYRRYKLQDYRFEQGGPLKIHNPYVGSPGQLIICSEKPFPGFDATRLTTGAADADESDAPLVPVATGAIAILLEGRLGTDHPMAREWRRKFSNACLKHLSYPTEGGMGKSAINPPFAAPFARVR